MIVSGASAVKDVIIFCNLKFKCPGLQFQGCTVLLLFHRKIFFLYAIVLRDKNNETYKRDKNS